MNQKRMILMTTSFRSGSALVSRILNAHSQIAMTIDKLKFFRFAYNRYLPLNPTNVMKMLVDLNHRLEGRFDNTLHIDACYQKIIDGPITHDRIYAILLENLYRCSPEKSIIGEMENLSWSKIPLFLNWYPNSKAMVMIRDIRDMVASFKKLTHAPGNDYLIALFNAVDCMVHIKRLEREFPDRVYCVRYEPIKTNTEIEVRKLCNFLGVDFESTMIDPNNWTDLNHNQWEKWKNEAVSAFYGENSQNTPVERWRKIITDEDLFLCEWIGRDVMRAFDLKFENRPISQEVFDNAMAKLMSSRLIRDAFKHWCETGEGTEKYPMDPFDPKTWTQDEINNPQAFEARIQS